MSRNLIFMSPLSSQSYLGGLFVVSRFSFDVFEKVADEREVKMMRCGYSHGYLKPCWRHCNAQPMGAHMRMRIMHAYVAMRMNRRDLISLLCHIRAWRFASLIELYEFSVMSLDICAGCDVSWRAPTHSGRQHAGVRSCVQASRGPSHMIDVMSCGWAPRGTATTLQMTDRTYISYLKFFWQWLSPPCQS